MGVDEGEDIGVAVAHKGNGCVENGFGSAEEQTAHGECHHQNADDEEHLVVHHPQEEGAREATDGTENEIEAGGKSGLIQAHVQSLHQYFRCRGVGAHVNAHMAHDADKRQQHDGQTQQLEALGK